MERCPCCGVSWQLSGGVRVEQHTRWRSCHHSKHSADRPASHPRNPQLTLLPANPCCSQTLCLLTALLDRTSLANALLAALLKQYSRSVRVRFPRGGQMDRINAQGITKEGVAEHAHIVWFKEYQPCPWRSCPRKAAVLQAKQFSQAPCHGWLLHCCTAHLAHPAHMCHHCRFILTASWIRWTLQTAWRTSAAARLLRQQQSATAPAAAAAVVVQQQLHMTFLPGLTVVTARCASRCCQPSQTCSRLR